MVKYTKELWTIEEGLIPGLFLIHDQDGDRIAKNVVKKRADLIVAAPALLAAMRTLLSRLYEEDWDVQISLEAQINEAEAAITKATGQNMEATSG